MQTRRREMILRGLRNLVRAFIFITPYIFRVLYYVLMVMLTSLVTILSGLPDRINEIAKHWQKEAVVRYKFPPQFERQLLFVNQLVATFTFVLGWVLLAYMTVYVVGLIF